MKRLLVLLVLLGYAGAQEYWRGEVVELAPEAVLIQIGGETVTAELPVEGSFELKAGQRVAVYFDGSTYTVIDYLRYPWLIWLTVAFVVLAGLIGRWKALRGVGGTLLSLLVLVFGVVPLILAGAQPLLVTFLGSLAVLLLAVYFVHGVNWKTSAALAGTLVAVLLTLGLAWAATGLLNLSGLSSEEAMYAGVFTGVDLVGLYLAGVVVGTLGALTDVTITQAAVVQALAATDPHMSRSELYRRGMRVGFDHIGSLINTLVLAYVGGALPLLVLLQASTGMPGWMVWNQENLASEVVRTLVGSMGLILAVPFTNYLAAGLFAGGKRLEAGAEAHVH